ncbi:hypothetical protein J5N97_004786 [Dioscorea zingiberensis]|uniref:Endonuclease/exonuclease/phosphatase domain-containing protein n=1 Tax=Dioscorea zingiberensis TaxID=325984 RepID=A0A9D5HRA8_9LILI|nr:hypothetical protein J5N97_004786 [Dioscorea zingiberensis]
MNALKVICWNCRGSSNVRTINRIKELMKSLQPGVVCLVETRADTARAMNLCKKFEKHWEWAIIPALGMSGGIITFWKQEIGMVTPLAINRYSVHLIISSQKPREWIISVIYNAQNIQSQRAVWRSLEVFSSLNLPWTLMGDFNAILNDEEHRGGSFDHYSPKSKLFNEFVSGNQLLDLGFSGSPFTWCNNQLGLARRWARLDRVLANDEWITHFESYYIKHLPRTASDHAPILLTAKFFTYHRRRVFRFENYWFEYENCHDHVCRAWSSVSLTSPMHTFSHCISRTRSLLSKWKIKGLNQIDKDIDKTAKENPP